jgi:hypothetical protein
VGVADDTGLAGAGVEFDDLVRAARAGRDAEDAAAVRREVRRELGPRSGRVDDLAGLRVEDAERGGAAPVDDGDQSVREGCEPASADLPQGAAELLLARAEGFAVAVQVPPAGAVAGVEKGAVGGPVDLGDRLVGTARGPPGAVKCPVGGHVGEHQFRTVPRHPRVVPGQPGGSPSVGREAGAGDELVPVVGEFAYGVQVLLRRAVQRHGGHDPAYVGGPVPGELLQYAPDFAPLEVQLRVHPAQSAAHERHGREGTRFTVGGGGLVHVQPLVDEVDEDDQRAGVEHRAGPGLSAVLDDPAAHVPRSGQHRLLAAVGTTAHQRTATGLLGPGLGPPGLVADEADILGVPVVRGGERRVDGRGPGTVGQGLHDVPHFAG